jgi:hypothetical protein
MNSVDQDAPQAQDTAPPQPDDGHSNGSAFNRSTRRAIAAALFRNLTSPQAKFEQWSLDRLRTLLTTHAVRPNKDGALFSLTVYRDGATSRADASIAFLTALVADCDESHTLEEIRAIAKRLGVFAIIYSSHRHGIPEKDGAAAPGERYRVVFVLAMPVPVEAWPDVWERLNLLFGSAIDTACKDPSRAYYLPSHPPGQVPVAEVIEGRAVALEDLPQLPPDFYKARFGDETPAAASEGRPGDDYNAQADNATAAAILERAGCKIYESDSSVWRFRRPGKNGGISGTIGFYGPGVVHVFTSEFAPFQAGHCYKPFQVLALLDHDGDFKAAARELGKQGFGEPSKPKSKSAKVSGRKSDAGAEGQSEEPDATSESGKAGKAEKKSQADTLVEIGLRGELFRTPNDEAHITIERNSHRETHRLKSGGFRDYLKSQHFHETGKVPSSQATQDALDTLAGFAYESGIRHETNLRVAPVYDADGNIAALYLDLGDDAWRAVEITADGWQIVSDVPVKFIRPRGVLPLPEPRRGGNINELRHYINVESDKDFCLFVAWELAAFQTEGALPILVINGPQGSAKTSTQRYGRQLLDPNATPTRAMPRNARDLMIAAKNSATASFDNVSAVEDWLSDAMCSLATGAGFATRELHSDGEETLITAKRRAILNGITGTGSRADFLDRCIILSLPRISDKKRRVESEVDAGFAAAHGAILGALLGAVAVGIRQMPRPHPAELPRMADFAKWATACETGFGWKAGAFLEAYKGNLKEGVEVAAEASPIVAAIRSYIDRHKSFEGTTSELSKAINAHVGEETSKRKDFPSGAQALGHALKRAVTVLQNIGIEAVCEKKENGKVWTLKSASDNKPNPDDVADDVEGTDDVEATSSATSSAVDPIQSKAKTKFKPNPDDADDVNPLLSPPAIRERERKEEETQEKADKKDNSGFTSSTSSASSADQKTGESEDF